MYLYCKILHYTISLKVVLGLNKIMNMKNFGFYFSLLYAFSLTNPLYVFDLSFP